MDAVDGGGGGAAADNVLEKNVKIDACNIFTYFRTICMWLALQFCVLEKYNLSMISKVSKALTWLSMWKITRMSVR